MALDGILLRQLVKPVQADLPLKIHKIYHLSENELLFQLRSNRSKLQLLISCHSVHNRLQYTTRDFVTPLEPTNFVMLMRKHLEDGIILDFKQIGLDRLVEVKIQQRNELGDIQNYRLMIELMGKYANLILLDSQGKIMDALKRIPPFENTKRTIQPGAMYSLPDQVEKRDPFVSDTVLSDIGMTQQFDGFSPLFGREVEFRLNHGESFTDIMREVDRSDRLFLHPTAKDTYAHCIPLKHLNVEPSDFAIMDGFDRLYQDQEEKERIKQHTGDLQKFITREAKKNLQKLPKLMEALDEALDCDKWRLFGDYLYAYGTDLPKGLKETTVKDFETGESLVIPLDERFDGKQNAGRYYQKYHKGRKGQSHIRHQIDLTRQEADYFIALGEQLSLANVNDAMEIREELAQGGYIPLRQRKKSRKEVVHYLHLALPNGIKVYIGKNNYQNDQITFKLANKKDTWLHAKDYHGAHVIVQSDNLDESTLRLAAQLAAYFSQARNGSSVPVNYCPVKEVKKIPNTKPGFVSLGAYKTIFIDPDENFVRDVLNRYSVKAKL